MGLSACVKKTLAFFHFYSTYLSWRPFCLNIHSLYISILLYPYLSWFQGDYWKGLVQETDCPSFDVDAANLRLETWVNDKRENILDYRDKVYPSLVTGQMSPSPRHKWVDAKRDCHFLHYFPTSKKQTAPSDTRHEDACTS